MWNHATKEMKERNQLVSSLLERKKKNSIKKYNVSIYLCTKNIEKQLKFHLGLTEVV